MNLTVIDPLNGDGRVRLGFDSGDDVIFTLADGRQMLAIEFREVEFSRKDFALACAHYYRHIDAHRSPGRPHD